jgi:uncharacterized membrane protein YfcA
MVRKNRALHSLVHFLAGFSLTLKGFNKLSHHYTLIGSIILAMGVVILVYFFYVLFNKHPSKKLDLLVHWFEAFAALFTAYVYFTEGARYLPYVFLLAAIGFFIAIYVTHYRKKKVVP